MATQLCQTLAGWERCTVQGCDKVRAFSSRSSPFTFQPPLTLLNQLEFHQVNSAALKCCERGSVTQNLRV